MECKVGMGNESMFFQTKRPACAKPVKCEMALWIQEWQVIHYCPSLSRMAKENIDQRKNCKKQGPDRASPCYASSRKLKFIHFIMGSTEILKENTG